MNTIDSTANSVNIERADGTEETPAPHPAEEIEDHKVEGVEGDPAALASLERLLATSTLTPVFYDERRKRWPWLKRLAVVGAMIGLVSAVTLAVSLFALPLMPRNSLPRATFVVERGNTDPVLTRHEAHPNMTRLEARQLEVKFKHDKLKLAALEQSRQQEAAENRRKAGAFLQNWPTMFTSQLPDAAGIMPVVPHFGTRSLDALPSALLAPAPVIKNAPPVVAAFYVNWEETSWASAQRNITHLTHFIPEWLHLKQNGADVDNLDKNVLPFLDARDDQDKTQVTELAHRNNVPVLALLNNHTRPKNEEEGEGNWDTDAVHALISNPVARQNFIVKLRAWLQNAQLQGINIDFEEVAEEDRDHLTQFMKELYAGLHPYGLLVTEDVQLESLAYDFHNLAKWNDWLIPMFYDEHEASSPPGPVAGIDWTRKHLNVLLKQVPAGKIVMAIGNHGYDWTKGSPDVQSLRYQTAVTTAKDSYDGLADQDGVIKLDPSSLNPTFHYYDQSVDAKGQTHDEQHTVWMQDAVSVFNQLQIARPKGIRGAALWMLGSEDPSIWSYYAREVWKSDWNKIVQSGALENISYHGTGEIDFTSEGELLQPLATPSQGVRALTVDPNSGLITSEAYKIDPVTHKPLMPSSYIVKRYGGKTGNPDKKIVLTFDDGPDPTYTPQILDILKRYHVPATFFVCGRNAENNPTLVRRMWDEGHEIGNHTWSHPDMAALSLEAQRVQLNSTQRVIQALTGHSTTMWRPPYGNDVEPTTGKEVKPLELASELNYLTVGQKIDPQDWALFKFKPGTETYDTTQPKSAQDILNGVMAEKDQGSIVLLHDAGGDRSRTVAALPQIIQQLRTQGYQIVSVAQLSHIPRSKLMPIVTGKDVLLVGGDKLTFETAYLFQRTLTTLFLLSIFLGVSRILLFVGLALIQRAREKRRVFPIGFTPSVSVIIAAYNEEKVIARTIEAILGSGYPDLEIIVVDDGSKDDTSGVVSRLFAAENRVRLVRKENGGKASALNRGLMIASGDIMVSLDADTLFAFDTIQRLARHFADPKVGAVSGNVRVGNTNNIFTRWQALEYTTSQNFDRRGYDLLNCITVVPGAVGAMRREAVLAVGGYTHDTLAEDTDLTWKLRRSGWRIVNDNSAMAYTEAPESLRNLAKQRFRWAFGTLQCLWKHRAALGNHGAFGWLALPSLWVYQILFPAISPFMDIGMVYALFSHNLAMFSGYFLAMFAIEFVAAFIALRMDKGDLKLLPWLFLQRFVYRQLMYYVVLKSLVAALRGGAVGWNKFERTGTARIETKSA